VMGKLRPAADFKIIV